MFAKRWDRDANRQVKKHKPWAKNASLQDHKEIRTKKSRRFQVQKQSVRSSREPYILRLHIIIRLFPLLMRRAEYLHGRRLEAWASREQENPHRTPRHWWQKKLRSAQKNSDYRKHGSSSEVSVRVARLRYAVS